MYQRGEVLNKPAGFWGMIKSVTSSSSNGESILLFELNAISFILLPFGDATLHNDIYNMWNIIEITEQKQAIWLSRLVPVFKLYCNLKPYFTS